MFFVQVQSETRELEVQAEGVSEAKLCCKMAQDFQEFGAHYNILHLG